jgi:hypothetical protein
MYIYLCLGINDKQNYRNKMNILNEKKKTVTIKRQQNSTLITRKRKKKLGEIFGAENIQNKN